MINENFFEQISRIHDDNFNMRVLNLILGAYNEIKQLDKKNAELTTKVDDLNSKLTKVIENIVLGTPIKNTNNNNTENAEEVK